VKLFFYPLRLLVKKTKVANWPPFVLLTTLKNNLQKGCQKIDKVLQKSGALD
jgi:hypothetical protein